MITTKAGIISLANILVGHGPIEPADIDPPFPIDKNIQTLKLLYNLLKPQMLSETWWSFARVIKQLSLQVAPPPFKNYRYSFSLPTYPKRTLLFQLIPAQSDFYIQGENLYANINELQAAYITEDIEEAKFSATFTTAFAHLLASKAAPTLISDSSLATLLIKEAQSLILKATAIDAFQEPMPPVLRDALMEAHNEQTRERW